MRSLMLLLTLPAVLACSLTLKQGKLATQAAPTTPTATALVAPEPTAAPGSEENPLILALPPTPRAAADVVAASERLTGLLGRLTGYRVAAVVPATEADLVDAIASSNVQIAAISPFGYWILHRNGDATAALASVKDDRSLYGAQFIANRDGSLEAYFDEALGANTASEGEALAQFRDKKPCWSDNQSPSGYVIPLGYLNRSRAFPRSGAFLEGQPPVVRAVYAEGICDFGATYIDARLSPALEAAYPDVLERVQIIWRTPDVIPYDAVVFSVDVPLEARRVLVRAFMDMMVDPEGKAAMQKVYGFDVLQPADEDLYAEFEELAEASGIDPYTLLDAEDTFGQESRGMGRR